MHPGSRTWGQVNRLHASHAPVVTRTRTHTRTVGVGIEKRLEPHASSLFDCDRFRCQTFTQDV
jgi:hypothetical protein